jgi:hypothetical protein
LEDRGVDWRIILKWVLDIGWEVVEWIHLVQDRDAWRDIVNMAMKLCGS